MWVQYIGIGLVLAILISLIDGIKRHNSKKAKGKNSKAYKRSLRSGSLSKALINFPLVVGFWPFAIGFLLWDAKLRKDGKGFGAGGGGYVNEKRTWVQFFKDEYHEILGKDLLERSY